MPAPYTGECLCGAVKLTVSSAPQGIDSCFCKHCRVGSGGTSQIVAAFPHDSLKIESGSDRITTHVFTDTASGAPKDKMFCSGCGVTLWTVTGAVRGKLVLIRPILLGHNAEEFKPEHEVYVKDRPSWLGPVEGVQQWKEGRK